ncbi:MAG: phospho-N-acetylmuramoyl-pentapeptide-transferase [Pyramidobacter sp.]|jgi:phospho-N-acetylmuramoyl-pentapeptide-transferase
MTKLGIETAFFFLLFFCETAAQKAWIGWMRGHHISQVQKAYGTRIDEAVKSKVPSMGGVVFLLIGSGLLISEIIKGGVGGMLFWSYPVLSSFVGLTDDVLKFRHGSSEGLRSMQKFFLQTATTIVWFAALALNGRTPCLAGSFSIDFWIWPFALFFAVGVQNSVNVTDGLDGLAAGAGAITFASLAFVSADSWNGSAAGLALSLGFLWHNCHPAQVFMGDVGAHFLAGLMASCAFMGSGGVLSLIPAAAGFGLEMVSVVIQLAAIHCFGRKVFRMSPVHHHFQLLGWPEDRIVIRFWIIHGLLVVALSFIFAALFLKIL